MSKTLSDAEARVVARLLDMAADEFSNHGCTDFNLARHMPLLLERKLLVKEIEERNSGGRDYDPDSSYETYYDWILMRHFANKLGRP